MFRDHKTSRYIRKIFILVFFSMTDKPTDKIFEECMFIK